jgi:sugar (pentulose or hexulose) kinase
VGDALTAAVGLGLYPGFEALRDVVQVEHEFQPQAENAEVYGVLYRAYQSLYRRLRGLYREVNEVRFRCLR